MPLLPTAKPEELGFDPARLQRAYDLLDSWTRSREVPGGAIVVGRHGRMVAPKFFGRMGPEADAAPIRDDALFLMASITKPIVYLGAMILVERGLLNLSDKVTRYIPEFAAHHKEDTLVLHLFTHTSGLPDMLANNVELRQAHAPLAKFVEHAIRDTVPLFPPGTNLSYQSSGTLITAELIQRLSGQPIADFLQREIFDPLGLASIHLGSQPFDRARLVHVQTAESQETSFGWNSRYWHAGAEPDNLVKMREMAERAIQLDPLLEEAHDALGVVYARDGQWSQAEASFRRAIELNPNSELTRVNYVTSLLLPLGRIDEAVQQLRAAERSDPLSPTLHYVYGDVLIAAGRFKDASVHCAKSSDFAECQGRVLLAEGRIDDAITILASAPNTRYLGYAYGRAGRRREVEELATVSPGALQHVLIYAGLGDKDGTVHALQRIVELGPVRVGLTLSLPELSFIRRDPRVKVLRANAGLPE